MKRLIILILLFVGWKQYYYIETAPTVGPGIMAGSYPYSSKSSRSPFRIGNYTYSPRSNYEVEARVIAASKYYFDRMSRISDIDLVLGWGPMSNEAIYQELNPSISNRFYEWDSNSSILSDAEVTINSSNYHIIASDSVITKRLRDIKIGDIVLLRGYLVSVKGASGMKWENRKSLLDKGKKKSGELFYVESMEIIDPYSKIY
jgi:hypothetical protein